MRLMVKQDDSKQARQKEHQSQTLERQKEHRQNLKIFETNNRLKPKSQNLQDKSNGAMRAIKNLKSALLLGAEN